MTALELRPDAEPGSLVYFPRSCPVAELAGEQVYIPLNRPAAPSVVSASVCAAVTAALKAAQEPGGRLRRGRRSKTRSQVRADFDRLGVSISAWAREHGVSASLVYEILAGRKKCIRGASHRVAVLLGLKAGEIVAGTSAVNAPGASA